MESLQGMSAGERLGEAMKRSLPLLGPEARAEVEKLLTPEALATIAAILSVWVGSHFVGIGEIVDIVFFAAGLAVLGISVFEGVEELLSFAKLALNAQTEGDLDRAARHFSAAVSILGLQAVLAVLFRGAPKTWRGGKAKVGPAPKFVRGAVARPPLRSTRTIGPGGGFTSPWGEIVISRLGTSTDRRLVALHESVHRLLTPKLNILRNFRVGGRAASYSRSPLSKFLEEAMAETVAQIGVNGFRAVFKGISFPVSNGYVTLCRRAVVNEEIVFPIIPELAGIVSGGFVLAGQWYDVRVSSGRPPSKVSP